MDTSHKYLFFVSKIINKRMIILVIGVTVLVIIVFIAIYVMKTYNSFITLSERVRNAKAQISTQIESRYDAVKSLIEATKRYEKYESETLERIVNQRVGILQDSSIEEVEQENDQLDNIVGRLIAIAESYPELKTSDVYVKTMDNMDTYENNVRHARMIYNDVVTNFNRMVQMFPSSIIASRFQFTQKEYFKGTDSKQDVPSWD